MLDAPACPRTTSGVLFLLPLLLHYQLICRAIKRNSQGGGLNPFFNITFTRLACEKYGDRYPASPVLHILPHIA